MRGTGMMVTGRALEEDRIPAVGAVVAGKYRVERVLGRGGMGAVVAATDLFLERRVAIKLLNVEAVEDADVVARFAREGKALAKIGSEHAVKVHEMGMLANGVPYLVMEHLDGSDLSAILGRAGPSRSSDVVDRVLQACEAIAEAHAIGLIHRDLKPSNLFLTHRADGSECVKVLDFGISKFTGPGSDMNKTRVHTLVGSPRYLSPEQIAASGPVDTRTDIWALGVMLYELVSGVAPFKGASMVELCMSILQQDPVPLVRAWPGVPPALGEVVQKCLAKNREQRYANVAELAAALAPFGSASARASAERIARVIRPQAPTASRAPAAGTKTARSARKSRWGRAGVAFAGAGALLLIGAVAGAIVHFAPPAPWTSPASVVRR